jgi:hypothetical protein
MLPVTGAPCENSHHFVFDCDKYTDNREIIFNSLNWLPSNINIDVNLLTKGSDLLTYDRYRKHLTKFLLYINRNSRKMHYSEAVLELYLVF